MAYINGKRVAFTPKITVFAEKTVYYEVTLSYADDDPEQINPIFTKTNNVLNLDDDAISNLPYNEAATPTTTGETVYVINGGETFCCAVNEVVNAKEIHEAGKKSEWGNFWDNYQNNGNRRKYGYAFYGEQWNDQTFKPKYDIIIEGTDGLSGFAVFSNSRITDLAKVCEDQGIKIDAVNFKPSTNMDWFNACYDLTRTPPIPVHDSFKYGYFYAYCTKLHTVEGFYVSDNMTITANAFALCNELQNLTIIGTIGTSGLDLHWSNKLNKASIISVINALSTTTTGLTVTLSLAAVNKAFETNEGANDGSTSDEWTTLIATKANWTISLV